MADTTVPGFGARPSGWRKEQAAFPQSDWSRLISLLKHPGLTGTIIIGVVAGSILVGGHHGGPLYPDIGMPPHVGTIVPGQQSPSGTTIPGEWPHDVPGKPDAPDGHNDTSETRDGPARVITNLSGLSASATDITLTRRK
jgi:hypothetical protein